MTHTPIRSLLALTLCAGLGTVASPVQAAYTYAYTFEGYLETASGRMAYRGSFEATLRPTGTAPFGVSLPPPPWQGTMDYYTGAINFRLSFADNTLLSADTLDVVAVHTTTYSGTHYPDGYSAQIYMNDGSFSTRAPVKAVCSAFDETPCGPDDDPLFPTSTSQALAAIHGAYFYFAQMPGAAVLPDSSQALVGAQMGIGFYSPNSYGYTTTTVSTLTAISATVTGTPEPTSPVPESGTAALSLAGLAWLAMYRRSRGR